MPYSAYFKTISNYYDDVELQVSYVFDARINNIKESIKRNKNELNIYFQKDLTMLLILNLKHLVYEVANSSINSYELSIFNKALEENIDTIGIQDTKLIINEYLNHKGNLLPSWYMSCQYISHLDTEALKALLERNVIDRQLSTVLTPLIKKVNDNINKKEKLEIELKNELELKQVKIDNIKENKENNILAISKITLEELKDYKYTDLLTNTVIYYPYNSTLVSLKNVYIEEVLVNKLIDVANLLKCDAHKHKHPYATVAINNKKESIITTIKLNGKLIDSNTDILEWLMNYGLDGDLEHLRIRSDRCMGI